MLRTATGSYLHGSKDQLQGPPGTGRPCLVGCRWEMVLAWTECSEDEEESWDVGHVWGKQDLLMDHTHTGQSEGSHAFV